MTAPVDVSSPSAMSKSRRALLAGALGGLGAWVASAVGRASPVQADNGEPVVVGGTHSGISPTSISSTGSPALLLSSSYTPGGTGVRGHTSAEMGIGLQGISHGTDGVGVDGSATASSGTNYGVVGQSASPNGAGLLGRTTGGGFALRTDGRIKADKVSGVATITAGSTSKTITPGVNVTASTFLLLTPKANIGSRALWFTTNATDNKFTIRMSSSRSSNTKVAWLLLG